MKSTGIVRRLDEMGRIILPVELRRQHRVRKGDELEILSGDNYVILRKYEPYCVFCEDSTDLVRFRDKHVCRRCISEA
jgi:transcriptional pleiotropic regulator of transition state genes